MASSSPASSGRGVPGSQRDSSRETLSTILDIDPTSPSFTCVGYATSSSGKCKRTINSRSRIRAQTLLLSGDCKLATGQELGDLLSDLASCVLCQSYHVGQTATIVAEWSRKVSAFKDSTQNSPSSTERASAIRALPSARNNLSSYARVEPVISSRTTESRQRSSEKERESSARPSPDVPSSRSARTTQTTSGSPPSFYGDVGRDQRTPYYLRSPREFERAIAANDGEPPSTLNVPRTPTRTPTRTPVHAETSNNRSTSAGAPNAVSRSRTAAGSRQTPTSSSTSSLQTSIPSPTPTPVQGTNNSRPRSNAAAPPPQLLGPTFRPSSLATAIQTSASSDPTYWAARHPYPYYYNKPEIKRRPIRGECSICYESLATAPDPWRKEQKEKNKNNRDLDPLVWCQAECGVNFHRSCFDCWKKTCVYLTCPNCRAIWKY